MKEIQLMWQPSKSGQPLVKRKHPVDNAEDTSTFSSFSSVSTIILYQTKNPSAPYLLWQRSDLLCLFRDYTMYSISEFSLSRSVPSPILAPRDCRVCSLTSAENISLNSQNSSFYFGHKKMPWEIVTSKSHWKCKGGKGTDFNDSEKQHLQGLISDTIQEEHHGKVTAWYQPFHLSNTSSFCLHSSSSILVTEQLRRWIYSLPSPAWLSIQINLTGTRKKILNFLVWEAASQPKGNQEDYLRSRGCITSIEVSSSSFTYVKY